VLIERLTVWGLCLGLALSSAAAYAQNVLVKHLHDSGQSITASYEGWFQNKDGSFSILFGYYNRNEKQVLDIPIGPRNRIEPGGPDQGPAGQGPLPIEATRAAMVGDPLDLTIWVADDARMIPGARKRSTPPIILTWSKFRGPGAVTFENIHPAVEKEGPPAANTVVSGRATTTATFSEPGEYVLEVVANDWTGLGGRGFLCCWTNGMVGVSVKAAP